MKKHTDQDEPACSSTSRVALTIPSSRDTGPLTWTRRRALTLGVSLVAGLVAGSWWPLSHGFAPLPSRRVNNPRFRSRRSTALYVNVALDEGFYARKSVTRSPLSIAHTTSHKKSHKKQHDNILQYVDSQ